MKFRLTVTAVKEWEVDPWHYATDECPKPTVKQMLVIDQRTADDDALLILGDDADWTAKVELVEDK